MFIVLPLWHMKSAVFQPLNGEGLFCRPEKIIYVHLIKKNTKAYHDQTTKREKTIKTLKREKSVRKFKSVIMCLK